MLWIAVAVHALSTQGELRFLLDRLPFFPFSLSSHHRRRSLPAAAVVVCPAGEPARASQKAGWLGYWPDLGTGLGR